MKILHIKKNIVHMKKTYHQARAFEKSPMSTKQKNKTVLKFIFFVGELNAAIKCCSVFRFLTITNRYFHDVFIEITKQLIIKQFSQRPLKSCDFFTWQKVCIKSSQEQ